MASLRDLGPNITVKVQKRTPEGWEDRGSFEARVEPVVPKPRHVKDDDVFTEDGIVSKDEPLKVGDWVTWINGSREHTFQIKNEGQDSWWDDAGNHYQFKNCRRATPQEIAAATGQPQEVVKESLNTEICVGDTVELLAWPGANNVKEDVGERVEVTGWSESDFCNKRCFTWGKWYRWPIEYCRLVSKGKSGQGEQSQDARLVTESATPKASPCPACGGDRYLPDEWGRCDEKHLVPCAKCNFKAGEPEPVLPPAPVHRMTEAGECVLCDAQALASLRHVSGSRKDITVLEDTMRCRGVPDHIIEEMRTEQPFTGKTIGEFEAALNAFGQMKGGA